jgi:hypothetical protein
VTALRRWRPDPRRMRLRRRLLLLSAPVAAVAVLVIVKSLSVVVAGDSAVSEFADRDAGALSASVTALNVLNVAEPAKASFGAGALAVLDNRLEDAERDFSESLARTDRASACPARVNLEIVRETLGDRAAATLDGQTAIARYLSAKSVLQQSPQGCFAGNTDPDPARRAVRNGAAARLDDKIKAAPIVPLPPPPPSAAGAAPTPPPLASGTTTEDPDAQLRLHPELGDPLDRLQQILRDAAAAQGGG